MATPYHVLIAPKAHHQITCLAAKHKKTVVKLLESLAVNPRPPICHKIEGMTGLHSEDVDNIRIIYKIDEHEVLILSVKQS